jgi:hypothetical protein
MGPLRRPPWFWIAGGLALGIVVTLLVFVREPGSTLTREGLAAARARWRAAAPADYDLDVATGGVTGARHHVEVRGGEVVGMTTGAAEASRSAWEYWSVEGLFGFLDAELANAEDPRAYGGDAGEVVLRVRFDPRYGYPAYFLRHVMGKKLSIEWKVTAFEPR